MCICQLCKIMCIIWIRLQSTFMSVCSWDSQTSKYKIMFMFAMILGIQLNWTQWFKRRSRSKISFELNTFSHWKIMLRNLQWKRRHEKAWIWRKSGQEPIICIAITPKLKKKKVQRTSEHQRHWLQVRFIWRNKAPRALCVDGDWVLVATHTHTHTQPDKPLLLTETGINSLLSSFLFTKRLTLEQSNAWSYRFWYSVSYYFYSTSSLSKKSLCLSWKPIHGFNGFRFPFFSGPVFKTLAGHFSRAADCRGQRFSHHQKNKKFQLRNMPSHYESKSLKTSKWK